MKLFITAKAGAREEKVEKIDDTHYRVWVKEQPEKGKANEKIIRVISRHRGVPRSHVTIISGRASKKKVLEVE